jgi:hypothetical protein
MFAVLVLALVAGCGSTNGKTVTDQRGEDIDNQGSHAMHETHYKKFLGAKKRKDGEIVEDENLRIGDWRFFYESSKQVMKDRAAAVDRSGRVVAPAESKDNLHVFLATEGMDAQAALERLAWLLSAMPLTREATDMPQDVQAVLGDPTLERRGDTMRFVGWMAMPPNVDSPVRFELDAPRAGAVSARFVPWEEVAQGGQ